MFEKLIETLKANHRTIVFTEGEDARILDAAEKLLKGGFLGVVLVGPADGIRAAAEKGGYDITGARIIDPAAYPGMDAMVDRMVELRKGKMTTEQCRDPARVARRG